MGKINKTTNNTNNSYADDPRLVQLVARVIRDEVRKTPSRRMSLGIRTPHWRYYSNEARHMIMALEEEMDREMIEDANPNQI